MAEAQVAHTCTFCKKETKNLYCKKCDLFIIEGHDKTCLIYDEPHDKHHPLVEIGGSK